MGHSLESIQEMKNHPFFKGIDFDEISKPDYVGNIALVEEFKVKLAKSKQDNLKVGKNRRVGIMLPDSNQGKELKIDDIIKESDKKDTPSINEKKIIIKGRLLKKNWKPMFNNKQLRFFELDVEGLIKYYAEDKGKKDFRGTFMLNHDTEITKVDQVTINI